MDVEEESESMATTDHVYDLESIAEHPYAWLITQKENRRATVFPCLIGVRNSLYVAKGTKNNLTNPKVQIHQRALTGLEKPENL